MLLDNKYSNLQNAFHPKIQICQMFILLLMFSITMFYIFYSEKIYGFTFKQFRLTCLYLYSRDQNVPVVIAHSNNSYSIIESDMALKLLNSDFQIVIKSTFFYFTCYTGILSIIYFICLIYFQIILKKYSLIHHPFTKVLNYAVFINICVVPMWIYLGFNLKLNQLYYVNYLLNLIMYWYPVISFVFLTIYYLQIASDKNEYKDRSDYKAINEYKLLKKYIVKNMYIDKILNPITLHSNSITFTLNHEEIIQQFIHYYISYCKRGGSLKDYLLTNLTFNVKNQNQNYEQTISLRQFQDKVIMLRYYFFNYEVFTKKTKERKLISKEILKTLEEYYYKHFRNNLLVIEDNQEETKTEYNDDYHDNNIHQMLLNFPI